MAASPEIQLPDKSTLLQPDWPSRWNHPMVYLSQWPLVMTCDLYSTCFKQRDTSEPGPLSLSVSISGVMWDNRQAFGRQETWHPSLGSHKMATMWIVSPAAVWSQSVPAVSAVLHKVTNTHCRMALEANRPQCEGLNQHLVGKRKSYCVL